jgi:hypothetical protein
VTYELASDLVTFAAKRGEVQTEREKELLGAVKYALRRYPKSDWYSTLLTKVERVVRHQYHEDTGQWTSPRLRVAQQGLRKQVSAMLDKTTDVDTEKDALNQQALLIARSLATASINVANEVAGVDSKQEGLFKVWVSMEDEVVRPTHAAADGQRRRLGETFTVGGHDMIRPGDLRAPIEEWANCRCLLAVVADVDEVAAALVTEDAAPLVAATTPTGVDMADDDFEDEFAPLDPEDRVEIDEPVPFWGVLAPEGVESGDGRRFSKDSLRSRPLPLPMAFQKVNLQGHDGSVRVGNMERVWRREGLTYYTGHFLTTVEEVDEVVGMMAESGGRMGVSVDADDGAMEMVHRESGDTLTDLMDGMDPDSEMALDPDDFVTEFTSARVCGATVCNIPAFHEAFIALGEVPEEFAPEDGEDLAVEGRYEAVAASAIMAISEKSWDGSASRFTDEEWKRSCILHLSDSLTKSDHKLPIREPNGDLSRAGVHAAASRIGQVDAPPEKVSAAKRALRGAYGQLDEEVPENLTAASFAPGTEDGPGWLTHPVDTDRLRDYWVRGRGAAKIGWGTSGDFNRCRVNLAKYVKPQHLNGYCANRHKDALGFWPGEHRGGRHALDSKPEGARLVAAAGDFSPAITLVAGAAPPMVPPASWFEDPHLVGPSAVVITEEGRVFGHVATWGTCHIGFKDVCVTPPNSPSDYAYFRTGSMLCDNGDMVPVGTLTMDTGHADIRATAKAAMAHYDDTGTASCYVAAGEDEWGIWVAGCVSPDLSPEKIIKMRGAALSGDWREIGGALEMVAALAVNVGGFPIPRTSLAASAGHQTALIAAGVVHPTPSTPTLDVEAIVSKTIEAMAERQKAKDKMAALAAERAAESRARLDALRAKVGV